MIDESAYWKNDLLKRSLLLRRYMAQKRWSEASFAKCEQTVMIGFYSIRKLIEAKKLTDVLANTSASLSCYPATGKPVTRINRWNVEKLYDLEASGKYSYSLLELCHQFVHSYIFIPVLAEEGGLYAIWVASDRQRSKSLLEVEVKMVVDIFENVSNDDVCSAKMTFDASIGDYRVQNA